MAGTLANIMGLRFEPIAGDSSAYGSSRRRTLQVGRGWARLERRVAKRTLCDTVSGGSTP